MNIYYWFTTPFSLGTFYYFTNEKDIFNSVLLGFLIAQAVNYLIYKYLWHLYLSDKLKK